MEKGREERGKELLLTGLSMLFERKASALSDSVGRWNLNSVKQPALRSHSVKTPTQIRRKVEQALAHKLNKLK